MSILREFLRGESAAGIALMAAAALALVVANSPLAFAYFELKHAYAGPLSVEHWVNDGLMAIFFLLVGLEIKREMLDGQLSTWPRRMLPGIAAAGGMIVPAAIYMALNAEDPQTLRGWAIPTATDIAFALGVLSLLGNRVPASLKVFLTALAILDDLGAVIIIAVFYTSDLSAVWMAAAGAVLLTLILLNRLGSLTLWHYLSLGLLLWVFVLNSGVHATLAGVALAMAIPLRTSPGSKHDTEVSPLHRLEHKLHFAVPFLIVPIFGFVNAGISFEGVELGTLAAPLTMGIAAGLVVGKLTGVLGASYVAVRAGWADMPINANWTHLVGVAFLCGIGFTMSLFVALLAFPGNEDLQTEAKLGILAGSLASAVMGSFVILTCRQHSTLRIERT